MEPFVPDDYRKRVLAPVLRRGVESSDSFELYDIPIEEADALADVEVASRLDEVWAFWQKQRDHPKYRILVEQLVAEHPERSAPLRIGSSRIAYAREIAARRGEHDAQRYQLLDNAIERLVARHGGIPESKRAGLDEIGTMGGLSADEVATRLRRHRLIPDVPTTADLPVPPVPAALSEHKLAQITELLAEFSLRRSGPPRHTLLAVLDLSTDDADDRAEIRARADGFRRRARELPAGRMRAIVDELLIDVDEILLGPGDITTAYLRSVTDRAADHLRPRIRAAILVEDRLHPDDHQFMLDEARELGLGTHSARRLIADIAAEYGGAVDDSRAAANTGPPPRPAPPTTGDWQRELRSARQALRKGRLDEARRRCEQARAFAGDDAAARRQIDAVADEAQRSQTVPASAPAPAPAPATIVPPAKVRVGVVDGTVRVSWDPSPTAGVSYRVTRIEPNGRRQVVGRTPVPELDDGGVGGAPPPPVYEVTATRDGVHSEPVISGITPPATARAPVPTSQVTGAAPADDLPAITDVVVTGGRIRFTWPDGITEAVIVIRSDAPPEHPADPAAFAKKITNTRYDIDGGFPVPGTVARPGHVAVAACRRDGTGTLRVATTFGPHARAGL
ncbi:hypothetical protein ACPXB3_15760 [Gordonia sp. DT219]|uniref:hypothetical protein n=1 Tax=Gordonia sp. DT219 TaxID=3416658 RepID=UPI003CEA9CF2